MLNYQWCTSTFNSFQANVTRVKLCFTRVKQCQLSKTKFCSFRKKEKDRKIKHIEFNNILYA